MSTSRVSWSPVTMTPSRNTLSAAVRRATAWPAMSWWAPSSKSLEMVRLRAWKSSASTATVALPPVPYVPPPGLGVPDALL
ncbi:hypothetical protein QF032_003708 [Streptomyces achromogenes]|nr:hypothetical protein [Streptomyces achromogenes]